VNLDERARRIRFILMDCDGVLTDGGLYYGAEGELFKRFDVKDGHGLVMWRLSGGRSGVLTARTGKAIQKRAEELKFELVLQGHRDKRKGFLEALDRTGLSAEEVCYVGDETNDLGPLSLCGLAVTPADAVAEARAQAHLITQAPGGHGAVRELCEFLLRAQGKWDGMVELMRHGAPPATAGKP